MMTSMMMMMMMMIMVRDGLDIYFALTVPTASLSARTEPIDPYDWNSDWSR
jgi:hypothetical protein